MALAYEGALGTVEIAATTSSIAAKGTFPAWWASTSPVNRVAASSVLALTVVLTIVAPPTIRTLLLALLPLIPWETMALPIDMVAVSSIVAIATLPAVKMICAGGAGICTNSARPAHRAVAVPSHWVAVPLVLALAGGGAVGPVGSGGTGVVAESASPPGETAATS